MAVKIFIIGGKLQGVEACYLASHAGFYTILIDKNENCPAAELADEFICGDIASADVIDKMRECAFVLPALENKSAIIEGHKKSIEANVPYIHDVDAYAISSSKIKSDDFFEKHNILCPRPYPNGEFPYIIKPSERSGSEGVKKVYTDTELEKYKSDDCVIQQYVGGPSYSIEVIGNGKDFVPLEITEIVIDDVYDCCRVNAGNILSGNEKQQMYDIANALGNALKINGIFDIETILCNGKMYVLEIDARLPSQTPTAVYRSSGVNMMEVIYSSVSKKPFTSYSEKEKYSIYEHLYIENGTVKNLGEHIMSTTGILQYHTDFFGCDEAIVTKSYENKSVWVVTLIASGDTKDEVERKIKTTEDNIKNYVRR